MSDKHTWIEPLLEYKNPFQAGITEGVPFYDYIAACWCCFGEPKEPFVGLIFKDEDQYKLAQTAIRTTSYMQAQEIRFERVRTEIKKTAEQEFVELISHFPDVQYSFNSIPDFKFDKPISGMVVFITKPTVDEFNTMSKNFFIKKNFVPYMTYVWKFQDPAKCLAFLEYEIAMMNPLEVFCMFKQTDVILGGPLDHDLFMSLSIINTTYKK